MSPVEDTDRQAPKRTSTRALVREMMVDLNNTWFIGIMVVWFAAMVYRLGFADLTVLPGGDQDPLLNHIGQVVVLLSMVVLYVLARRAGIRQVDHDNDLGITRDHARTEAYVLLGYLVVAVVLGYLGGVHTHLGFSEATDTAFGLEQRTSTLLYPVVNTLVYVVVPLLWIMRNRGHGRSTLMLGHPRDRAIVVYSVVMAIFGSFTFLTAEVLSAPPAAHLGALLLSAFGTLIPVMIFTQALLAPRLAILGRSWVTGSVGAALVYATFNANEYFVSWGTPEEIFASVVNLAAGDMMWGLLKGMSTLIVASSWMHIWTTHTLHVGDADSVAKVFNLR